MPLSAHTINSEGRVKKNVKRVGRGNATGKGTYSGRGLKGQRSRSGGAGGLKLRGFKQGMQKVPKLRGFNSIAVKPEFVSLSDLERKCEPGDVVSPLFLKRKGLIRKPKNGVKILNNGKITKKITIDGCVASKSALQAIEKAGGKFVY